MVPGWMVNEAPESTKNQAVEHILIVGGPDHVGTGSGVQADLHHIYRGDGEGSGLSRKL